MENKEKIEDTPRQYPIGGYAPGFYHCTCVTCKENFQGDKRAVQCESCAVSMIKKEPKQETLEEAATKEGLFRCSQHNYNQAEAGYNAKWFKRGAIFGAKWQAERMYTKEDVLKAGKIGEINHHDYKYIVSLLDEAKKINNGK